MDDVFWDPRDPVLFFRIVLFEITAVYSLYSIPYRYPAYSIIPWQLLAKINGYFIRVNASRITNYSTAEAEI
jgi:hypothetical protein